jgi:hypothetical protein
MVMIRCKFIHFLFNAFPVKFFQGFLVKRHFEKCPSCLEELVELEEAQAIFDRGVEANERIPLWPGIQAGICGDKRKKAIPRFLFRWKWAFSAACLILVIAVGYWSIDQAGEQETAFRAMTEDQIQINYINIEEKPAGAFVVYQSQDSETIYIYADRTP